ncbi:glycosyltransferase involved in cell wall biosynthesis [Saccharothrix ecbatanensis]|uniref:Glycosyltransferase involved in cell wall biosynthesis n=1 Tax=Saccharothrix ecbatanensis TaxID=1105145 RepID=A0A7W9M5I3_9PSEU|nr:glycosyltransferase family 4 protein [Saccharothrix ecbatanensis]MBB5807989.1 glycosyltransferase involved in cell wall biosynthesis [Saccharothrix ecbatanensis]
MTLHFVLPGGVDDPTSPSGGNVYDRRVIEGLRALGTEVHEITVPGTWPQPDLNARADLARALVALDDGAVVLLDGLVACGVPEIVVPHAGRLRLIVLVHLPLAAETGLPPAVTASLDTAERECLRAVRAVIATSPQAARHLTDHHGLTEVHAVNPGTDPAPLATGTDGVSQLLCVASLTPRKGHDVLIEALATVADLPWTCTFVGPGRPTQIQHLITHHALTSRIHLTGPLAGTALDRAYATADLFVLPSRAETYGMVVTEALARGIPVIASAVPDALATGGLLLPPGDVTALAQALHRWLTDNHWRHTLRTQARTRRTRLSTWDETAAALARVASAVGADCGGAG